MEYKTHWIIGIGAISGLIGGKGANGKELMGIAKTSKTVLKTAVSPKKIAMYSAKLLKVEKQAIISCLRTGASIYFSNRMNALHKISDSSER
ncbi:MAG: hypothetical protein Q4B07_05550 [Clostridia bacterium]|nr:hypothetical protein [Clostridia bacterium]